MTIQPMKIIIVSENGEKEYPSSIELTMTSSLPDCPVTIWQNGKAVFSMGCDEIHDLIKVLEYLHPS